MFLHVTDTKPKLKQNQGIHSQIAFYSKYEKEY